MTTFLASDDGKDMSTMDRFERDADCFYRQVIHPDWNHDSGDATKVHGFSGRMNIALLHMQELVQAKDVAYKANVTQQHALVRTAQCLANLSADEYAVTSEEPLVADTILSAAVQCARMSQQLLDQSQSELTDMYNVLEEWRHISAKWLNLLNVHRSTMHRSTTSAAELATVDLGVDARCDTILNIVLAEMNVLESQLQQDLSSLALSFVHNYQNCHERALEVLRSDLHLPFSMASRRRLQRLVNNSRLLTDLDTVEKSSYIARLVVALQNSCR